MDCAVRETSSSAPAEAPVEPKAKPPAAAATPVITCRRVGKFIMAIKFVLSLIFVLHLIFTRPQRIRPLRQNMFKIIFCLQGTILRGILSATKDGTLQDKDPKSTRLYSTHTSHQYPTIYSAHKNNTSSPLCIY